MKELKFFKCNVCGNIAIKLVDKNIPLFCCGQKMQEIDVNSTDAAQEKHLPVIEQTGNKIYVKIGEIEHPMTESHYISHIIILTTLGYYGQELNYADKPEAVYYLKDEEKLEKVYSICNLHGIWCK